MASNAADQMSNPEWVNILKENDLNFLPKFVFSIKFDIWNLQIALKTAQLLSKCKTKFSKFYGERWGGGGERGWEPPGENLPIFMLQGLESLQYMYMQITSNLDHSAHSSGHQ